MVQSFGKVVVAAAGTPVRITTNRPQPTNHVPLQSVSVQALSGNSGANIYVGGPGLVKATLVDCYAIVLKGSLVPIVINLAPASINGEDIYIDADSSGDAALVSGTVQ